MMMLHKGELLFIGTTWGYRTSQEAAEKKKRWICARVEKSLIGRCFRHMFNEGRVIIPASQKMTNRNRGIYRPRFSALREKVPLHPAIP
jgi:putative SOS response-associated peptidase YedK